MQITSYPDIEELLSRLLCQIQRILDNNLIGLYLYGSLVTGDFDLEISDIDMLAVTLCDIDSQQFEQLRNMHNEVSTEYPKWDGRIEIQYLSANALQTFKTHQSQIAVISPGEPFNIKDAGIDWLINWYIVRQQGMVLFGPNPQTVIPPILSILLLIELLVDKQPASVCAGTITHNRAFNQMYHPNQGDILDLHIRPVSNNDKVVTDH